MPRYLRIRCIVKSDRTDAHQRVRAICGLKPDASHWTLTHGDAVSQIEDGTSVFYIERTGGRRLEVVVAMDLRAHKYLKTVEDEIQPEELLYLPSCPHVEHVPYLMPGERVKSAKPREWLFPR
jgi:hypothetical protein